MTYFDIFSLVVAGAGFVVFLIAIHWATKCNGELATYPEDPLAGVDLVLAVVAFVVLLLSSILVAQVFT